MWGSELQGLFVCVGRSPPYPTGLWCQEETKGLNRPGVGGIQETPGGGAKTSKVAAIMAADGHWRALTTKWHYVKTEQEVKAGSVQQAERWRRKKNQVASYETGMHNDCQTAEMLLFQKDSQHDN